MPGHCLSVEAGTEDRTWDGGCSQLAWGLGHGFSEQGSALTLTPVTSMADLGVPLGLCQSGLRCAEHNGEASVVLITLGRQCLQSPLAPPSRPCHF